MKVVPNRPRRPEVPFPPIRISQPMVAPYPLRLKVVLHRPPRPKAVLPPLLRKARPRKAVLSHQSAQRQMIKEGGCGLQCVQAAADAR
jgi:hypothetical protein